MPAQEIAFLPHRAVLWAFTGYDRYGQPTVAAPVEIPVRWSTNRMEMLDPHGNTIQLEGSAVVALKVLIGSRMWRGTLSEWYGTGSAGVDDELSAVKAFKDEDDIRGRSPFRTVGLMRLRNV